MSILSKQRKWMAGILAASMLFALPAVPVFASKLPSAGYSTVQLEAKQMKEMTYFATGSADIPALEWVTGAESLTLLPPSVMSDVTSVVKDEDGVYWIGTKTGLQRVDFTEEDPRDIVQYMAGPRYLYGGDDQVTGLAGDGDGGIWVRTASGVTHIAMPKKTLYEKSAMYEQAIKSVHDRRGMTSSSGFSFASNDGAKGINYSNGKFTGYPGTSDNDGLWTSMYAIGEIYRYKTLEEQYGSSPTSDQGKEIEDARKAALRATKAVLLLDYVSGRGNGFPARSYMLTTETGAITSDRTDYSYQSQNGFWFHHVVGPAAVNPNGIVPSLQRDDATPIGYAIVRVTKDSMSKKGSTLFASGGTDVMNYNGLGLSQAAIDELNKTRPDGQKLGIDIKTRIAGSTVTDSVYQVLPVITAATNNASASDDKSTNAANKPLFQLTHPVYEKIPKFFNDLFANEDGEYAVGVLDADGYIDMNNIVYKADTSSDEVIGHYALFFAAYKYLIEGSSDPDMLQLKAIVEQTTKRMTDLILKDDHYYIEDATGKSTQWSRWFAKYFNDFKGVMEQQPQWQWKIGVDANGDDALSYGFEDAPLNALEVMAALKTASYVVAQSNPVDAAKYQAAYEMAFNSGYSKEEPYVNGKGYIHMALEYIDRRLVRQATNGYDINDNAPLTRDNYQAAYADTDDVEDRSNINATLHDDWTQYINYSDEELAWFALYPLIMLENEPGKRAQIVAAFDQWYENETREENPYYTFLYQIAHPDRNDIDLQSAVRYLYRQHEFQIEFPNQWYRQDVFYIEPGDRDDYIQTNYALAPDERRTMKNNGNPFETDNQVGAPNPSYNYNSGSMEVGFMFTLPYWMGRYFGIIQE